MATVPFGADPNSYGAKLRAKGVQIDAGQAKSVRRGTPDSNARYNNWEKGVAGETRPDGSFMPYLNSHGDPIHVKEMSEGKRDKAKKALHDLRSGALTTGATSG